MGSSPVLGLETPGIQARADPQNTGWEGIWSHFFGQQRVKLNLRPRTE